MISKMVKDILTGIDNETYDHGRVLGVLSYIFYYCYAFANLWQGHPWAAIDFASGISAMAVAFGIHLKLKSGTEPDKKE